MAIRILYSYQGKERSFERPAAQVIIGRPKEGIVVDLDLTPDLVVSRPHARIWLEEGQYWIEDLGSTRGTQVNSEEIKGKGKRRLQAGDTIQVGSTALRVEIPGETPAQASPRPEVNLGAALPPEIPSEEDSLEIGQTIAADSPAFAPQRAVATDAAQRLALLYELPLQFAEQMRLESLLQAIVERLVAVIPGAARGALLVRDRATNTLLLKAHLPPGEPSVSMTLAQRAIEKREGFIWQRGEEITASMSSSMSGMYAPLLWKDDVIGVLCVDNPSCERLFDEEDLRLLLAVARYAAMAVANRRLQEDIQNNAALLARLLTNFSPKVRDELLKKAHHGKLRLGGEKSECTILRSDIRGFTRISATMDTEDVVDMLNDYFAALVNTIFRYDGTVDYIVGDAILAVFGSPESDPKQHENAIRAGLEMQSAVKSLNEERQARGLVTCNMGIGINCGEVLHGFVGAAERMQFTVNGDAVNRAARYCDGAQAGEVLISPEMHQRVWRMIQAKQVSIPTKHEGDFVAYSVGGVKES